MAFEQINEPIEVISLFKEGSLVPVKFLWQGKQYVVSKVNLAYHHFEGRIKIYFFTVSDNANYFKLQFNSDSLNWTLLESYVD
ncbi:MAG: hypothetical protein ACM3KM_01190 [Acidobacteriaceae bacterium]